MGSCCNSYMKSVSPCCTQQTCLPTTQDLLDSLCQIDTDLRTILGALNQSNLSLTPAAPMYVRNPNLESFLNDLICPNGLPVNVCVTATDGSWNREDADDVTGITLAANAWRRVIVTNPAGNSNAATIDVGGNVVTIAVGDSVDIAFPENVNTPAVTVNAGAGETVVVETFVY